MFSVLSVVSTPIPSIPIDQTLAMAAFEIGRKTPGRLPPELLTCPANWIALFLREKATSGGPVEAARAYAGEKRKVLMPYRPHVDRTI